MGYLSAYSRPRRRAMAGQKYERREENRTATHGVISTLGKRERENQKLLEKLQQNKRNIKKKKVENVENE